MMVRCSRIPVVGAVAVLLGLCGCEGLRDPVTKTPDPVQSTKPDPQSQSGPEGETMPGDLKPKKAELPKLPKGAEPMDDDAPDELTPTASGLYYRILRKSDGTKPTRNNTVVAHYKGWFDDGKQFDSSYDRGEPSEFPLGRVVAGWTEGLQLVGKGGMIELEIPYQLGYGAQGRPGSIPPKATLHFIVELKEVK
jgi:FKBP-type peptidyl-prolyl cis-trans isomerase FkpA